MAATEIVAVPLPLPDVPLVIRTKASLLAAVQLQPVVDADTVTVAVPPAAGFDTGFGDTENVQLEVGAEGDVGDVDDDELVQAAHSAATPTRIPRGFVK